MKEIDFFSVKGSNVNKKFNLNKVDNFYYNWEDVKKEVIEKFENDESKMEEVDKFDLVIVGRKSRLERLKRKLEERNIKLIEHSYLVRNYVMYARKSLDEVVRTLYMMKILFEKCDIKVKWERYKCEKGKQIYSFEEKDKFYEAMYEKYIDLTPSAKY